LGEKKIKYELRSRRKYPKEDFDKTEREGLAIPQERNET